MEELKTKSRMCCIFRHWLQLALLLLRVTSEIRKYDFRFLRRWVWRWLFVWDVAPCSVAVTEGSFRCLYCLHLQESDDGGSRSLRNFGQFLRDYPSQDPRRQWFSEIRNFVRANFLKFLPMWGSTTCGWGIWKAFQGGFFRFGDSWDMKLWKESKRTSQQNYTPIFLLGNRVKTNPL
jgi:hypothetical protein